MVVDRVTSGKIGCFKRKDLENVHFTFITTHVYLWVFALVDLKALRLWVHSFKLVSPYCRERQTSATKPFDFS